MIVIGMDVMMLGCRLMVMLCVLVVLMCFGSWMCFLFSSGPFVFLMVVVTSLVVIELNSLLFLLVWVPIVMESFLRLVLISWVWLRLWILCVSCARLICTICFLVFFD